ncbi:MAG TPA: hypothetical protein VHU40_12610 [Polyangia bacterium]|nr:hypothetical protein [Polyangia bacterium]
MAVTIWSLVERLAQVFAEGDNKLEAIRARDEFFEKAGKVFDDDGDLFEGRMASFLEWYIIERPFAEGPPLALRVAGGSAPGFTAEERAVAVRLATSHRSLFEVVTVNGNVVEIDDLLGGARFLVTERRSTIGFEPGALFEARLVWDGQGVVFGKTFLFHPPDAHEQVMQVVERAQARNMPALELLFLLSRLYVRWNRFNHLGAAKIYAAGEA